MIKVIDDDLLAFMGEQESQFLINPSSLLEKVKARFTDSGQVLGDLLPWSMTHKKVGLRQGEVSLWSGISGHGKSLLISQVCAWGLTRRWLIASMEMLPEATMERMVKQMACVEVPSDEYTEMILKWTDERLWLYDQTDSIASDRILALVRFAANEKIDHLVIDSLMKCGIGKDNLEGQATFVNKLCWLAKAHKIHIHLVHHIRKGKSEKDMPGKFDIRGAAEIVDQVDNIFIVHRNLTKEDDLEKHKDEPDCFLNLAKQRHGKGKQDNIYFGLYFHESSGQFTGDPKRTMNHWINV
jgi:twinkle protein